MTVAKAAAMGYPFVILDVKCDVKRCGRKERFTGKHYLDCSTRAVGNGWHIRSDLNFEEVLCNKHQNRRMK